MARRTLIRTIRLPPQSTTSSGIVLPTSWKRLALADALSTTNPSSRLAAAFTDGGEGVGITAQITGGWSSNDPATDWPSIIFTPLDAGGSAIGATDMWSIQLLMLVRTAPGTSSDTSVMAGVLNASADGAGIDGSMHCGILWTGGSQNMRSCRIINGAASAVNGSSSATLAHVMSTESVYGTGSGANEKVVMHSAFWHRGLTSARAAINTSATASNQHEFGENAPYIWLSFGRTAITAGTETVKVDVYYQQSVNTALPS